MCKEYVDRCFILQAFRIESHIFFEWSLKIKGCSAFMKRSYESDVKFLHVDIKAKMNNIMHTAYWNVYNWNMMFILFKFHSTHWGWVMHTCVSKLNITGSDNGLSPGWCQTIR